jgi:hypothetical protein
MRTALTVYALLGVLLSPASAQENTDEAYRFGGVQRFEFTRFVPSGKTVALDFAYALNPDCSLVEGGVDLKTTSEPSNGTVEFKPGIRFPNFSKTNVRYKCNEKKTNGTLINYKSKAGYVGTDKFEVLVLYPSGYAREVEYTVNVK